MNNTITTIYEWILLCCIAGFAIYDLYHRRVPDRALVFFCPLFGTAPLFHTGMPFSLTPFLSSLGASFCGAAAGFFLLLSVALMSKGGAGIGGGDIKITALMGFAYGTRHILTILLIASLLAGCAAFLTIRRKRHTLSLPFVPFLAVGSLVTTMTALF